MKEEKILKYFAIVKDDVIYKIDATDVDFILGNVINTKFGYYEILGVINGVGITKFKDNNYENQ